MNGATMMNQPTPTPTATATANGTVNNNNGAASQQLAMDINSYRIGVVAEKIAMYVQPSSQKDDAQRFFQLCLSLARGIDYGVANNEPPAQASKLAPILKQVCCRKNELYLQAAIMVLMISVKNACKLGWFSTEETEDLLTLAEEVGGYFCTTRDINSELSGPRQILSSVISRFYPQYKVGDIIALFEVKPGYGTYLFDFHITKDLLIPKDVKIKLLVAMIDNVDTSSCIVTPQQVNILLNGRPVDKRTNVLMDPGPQLPTTVNSLLKYGTNLLQAVGRFNGHYILVIAPMTVLQTSELQAPEDYLQPDSSGSDPEVIEGASRISLNCPISYRRIRIPAKGHLCKHYQCFDLSNYIEMNSKRPSWRCPHCNQSVCFTDLRVDRKMVEVLQEAGENVSEVTISAGGTWAVASDSSCRDESHDITANRREGPDAEECSGKSDAPSNVYDLTGEEDGMEIENRSDLVDTKPIVHHNLPAQPISSNSTLPTTPSVSEANRYFSTQVAAGLSSRTSLCDPGTVSCNMRSEAQTVGGVSRAFSGNAGMVPVLTDAVSPSLYQHPDNFQRTNYPTSSIGLPQFSAANNLQLQELYYNRFNVDRVPSAIQALGVPMPTTSSQQHARSNMHTPAANGASVRYQMLHASMQQAAGAAGSNFDGPAIQALKVQMPTTSSQQHVRSNMNGPAANGSPVHYQMPPAPTQQAVGSNIDRQRHIPQPHSNPIHVSNMASVSLQNRVSSQGGGVSTPSYQSHMPQGLSQPPHMRSSQRPRTHVQPGFNVSNSPSTIQRVQLMSQQPAQTRQHPITPSQTQSARTPSSAPLNSGVSPQTVPRTDVSEEQPAWQPSTRMRGALTGSAYAAALSQMGLTPEAAQAPASRPAVSTAAPAYNIDALLAANRMVSYATQVPNQSASHPATASGSASSQAEGSPRSN